METADLLAALRLQLDWGADEALIDAPVDRLAVPEPRRVALRQVPAPPPGGAAARAAELAARAEDVAALRTALAGSDVCPLAVTATHLVFAEGAPTAGLVIIGDCPGAEEDRTGRPFVGPAGQFLDRMLASIEVDRTNCVMTLVVPWRPPGDRAPTPTEVQTCLPFLQRHLALLRPRHLLLLGQMPARLLIGATGTIAQLRGRFHAVAVPGLDAKIPALVMQPPAYVQQRPEAKRAAWGDLLMLRRAMQDMSGRENVISG